MQNHFKILNITRNNILKTIENLNTKALNTIPEGFKNNIIWNIAHIIVTQQLLCYKLANLPMCFDTNFIDKYKKGSEVNCSVSQEEVDFIKEQLLAMSKKVATDYEQVKFKNFTPYPTSFNFTLNNIEDAIVFNNTHEALHLGYIMAMKKLI